MKQAFSISTFHTVLLFSFLLFFLYFACEKNDITAAQDTPSTQHAEGKIIPKKGESPKSSPVIVEVNGVALTQDEAEKKVNKILESIKGKFPPDQTGAIKLNLRKKIIEDFITRTLINQESDRLHITLTDKEITQAINEIKAKLPENMSLETALEQNGLSMAELRNDIIFSLRTNKLFDTQITIDAPPSEEEIRNYYLTNKQKFSTPETVHARHILIALNEKDSAQVNTEKKAKAEAIRKELAKGKDFETLAKEHSDCPSRESGGDLGTFERGTMVKPFEDAAFSQKIKEIGPIIQTQFGYHIIQVLEHNSAVEKPLEEVRAEIAEILQTNQRQAKVSSYITELRNRAKINYGTSSPDSQDTFQP